MNGLTRRGRKIKRIKNIEDIRDLLLENKIKIFGVGAYPSTRSEIWPLVPDYEVICANKTGEYDSVQEKLKVAVFAKGKTAYPMQKPGMLLSDKRVIGYIKKNAEKKRVGIYYYKPDRGIDQICKKNNWAAIANPSAIFEKLDDKLEFLRIMRKTGIRKDSLIVNAGELEKKLPLIFKKFGKKIVIQLPKEGGGRGTFFFCRKDKDKISGRIREALKSPEIGDKSKDLIASRFVDGPSVSISGCITKDNGILVSSCRYQLTDIREATKVGFSGVFCGNDWSLSQNIPESIHKKAGLMAKKIGKILKIEGARGIFGIDFIWDKKKNSLMPLEINPRLLGTIPVSAQTHLIKKEVPLEAFHALEFLNIKYKIASEKVYLKNFAHSGAHLIIYNQLETPVKCTKNVEGGSYRLERNKLRYVRKGFELSDLQEKGTFILTDGVPTNKYIYRKNRKLFRIITREKISRNGGKELNGWGRDIVRASRSHFNFQPAKKN
jgi:predicted ATP-grasp superfamily ATP-dependent carboligase